MKQILLFSVAFLTINFASGQTFKENQNIDLAISIGSSELNGSLSWSQIKGISKNEKFKLGYGVRLNNFNGSNKDYTTAPAELTSKKTGPAVFFSETFPENIDTFRVSKTSMSSINATIYIEYAIKPKWDLGFNIDAVGVSFGKETEGSMISSVAPANSNLIQKAKPTSPNILLISDNDIGMLNSELYARYHLNDKAAIRFGFNFEFMEYTTNNKISYNFDNDRFRYKTLMGMVAFSFQPFK